MRWSTASARGSTPRRRMGATPIRCPPRFVAGDALPIGVTAYAGMEANDLVLWIESHRALVAGDTLQDRGNGLQFLGDLVNNVPAGGATVAQILESMQPLLALPVEIVLLTHGTPADKAALGRALATPTS